MTHTKIIRKYKIVIKFLTKFSYSHLIFTVFMYKLFKLTFIVHFSSNIPKKPCEIMEIS